MKLVTAETLAALDERWRLFRDEAVRHANNPARIATVFDDHRLLIEAAIPPDPRLDALLAAERRLRAALTKAEWHQQRWNGVPSCPLCGGYRPTLHGANANEPLEGHRDGCSLQAALATEAE